MQCGKQLLGAVELAANAIREAVSGSCDLRTVNFSGQVTSEFVSVPQEWVGKAFHKRAKKQIISRTFWEMVCSDSFSPPLGKSPFQSPFHAHNHLEPLGRA